MYVDQKRVALVQNRENKTGLHWCKRLLGDPFSGSPKHLLHPLLTTLGNFKASGLCSRHLGSQPYSAIPFRGQLDVQYPPLFCLHCKQAECQCDRGLYGGDSVIECIVLGKPRAIGYSYTL